MKLKLIFAAMMLGLAMPAAADFETSAEAHETYLVDVRLPQSITGTIAFRTCDTCQFRTERVDGNTRWVIDGRAMSLKRFRAAIQRGVDRTSDPVTVLHHLERDRVIEVSVHILRDAQ